MTLLCHGALLSRDDYLGQRSLFRDRAHARAQARTIPLGAHATLMFEDALTVQQQLQEQLIAENIVDAHAVQRALADWLPLISSGSTLSAVLSIHNPVNAGVHLAPAELDELAQRVYAEVEGLGRCFSIVMPVPPPAMDDRSGVSRRVRFALTAEQIMAARAGAEFGFGIDDDRMRVGHSLRRSERATLLADLSW